MIGLPFGFIFGKFAFLVLVTRPYEALSVWDKMLNISNVRHYFI